MEKQPNLSYNELINKIVRQPHQTREGFMCKGCH